MSFRNPMEEAGLTRLSEAPVFIGKKDPIDTSGHEPDKQLLTWMRALNV